MKNTMRKTNDARNSKLICANLLTCDLEAMVEESNRVFEHVKFFLAEREKSRISRGIKPIARKSRSYSSYAN